MLSAGDKSIITRGYELPLGTKRVDVSDKYTRERVTVSKAADDPNKAVCTLTYRAEIEGKTFERKIIDHNCDGMDEYRTRKVGEKKWSAEPKPIRGLLGGMWRKHEESLLEAAIKKLCPDFHIKPFKDFAQAGIGGALTVHLRGRETHTIPSKPTAPIAPAVTDHAETTTGEVIKTNVFFKTAKSELSGAAKRSLDRFVKQYEGGQIVVEGHCDYRGTTEYNFELGKQRGLATAKYLTEKFQAAHKKHARIAMVSYGESKSGKTVEQRDRRSTVRSPANVIELGLRASKSDYYLIDSSGSMAEEERTIRAFDFPKKAKIYSFNSCIGLEEGIQDASCGTPLWNSLRTLLHSMPNGKSLTIFSDGKDSNVTPYRIFKKIIDLAKEKRIKISVVFSNKPDRSRLGLRSHELIAHKQSLMELAEKTGGSFYIEVF